MVLPPLYFLTTKRESCPAVLQKTQGKRYRQLRVEDTAKQDSIFESIAKLGLSLSKEKEISKKDHTEILSIQKSLIEKTLEQELIDSTSQIQTSFETDDVSWNRKCQFIEDLSYALLGILYLVQADLLSPPSSLDISSFIYIVKNEAQLLSRMMSVLQENLEKVKELTVTEAPNITYSQLCKYQRIANEYFNKQQSIKEPKSKYRRRSKELDHALSLNPLNRCFFIHFESPVKGIAHYDRDYDMKTNEALMVSEESITRVFAITCDQRAYSYKELRIKNRFSHSPHIETAPLCIVTHHEVDEIITNMHIEKVSSLCIPLISDFSCYGRDDAETCRVEIFIPLLLDIARGLNDLHHGNCIHGNIRPENLVIASDPKKNGVIAMISGLDSIREVDKKGKKSYRRSLEKVKRSYSSPKNTTKTLYLHKTESSLYSSPEYLLLGQEAELPIGDIWSFGMTAWQCLYGTHSEDSLFPNSVANLTEMDVYKILNEKLPKPRTEQEYALQTTIRDCLQVNPLERIESDALINRLEEVSKTPSAPYKPPFEERNSLENFLSPFTASTSKRRLKGRRSFSIPKKPVIGTQSLPSELFTFFTEEGTLGSLIDNAKKLIEDTLLNDEATIEKITSAKESLNETYHLFNDLENRVSRYKPSQEALLQNRKEKIDSFKKELLQLEKIVNTARLKHGGGLTFDEFCEIKKFVEKQLKALKKEKPRSLGNGPKAPLFVHHFPKNTLEGLKYSLSIDIVSGKFFVHLKKNGSRKSALGKGADKSAHVAIQIFGEIFEGVGDVVIRKETFNYEEQKLKELFADCSFIDPPAPYFTVYEKEEVPGLWKEKANLSQEQVKEYKEKNQKTKVSKVAFLGPLYSSSLSGLSYELKGESRDIPLIIDLLHDVIEGLAFMHQKGYIHRDLKPGNIFIKKEMVSGGAVYRGILADLGEVVYVGNQGVLPPNKKMAGTEHYYSPEICHDKNDKRYQRQSFASDVWAFGVLVCQALYGESGRDIPFLDNESSTHLCNQISNLAQKEVDEALESRFPKEPIDKEKKIQNIIRQCLRVDPASRPTASELAEIFSKNFKYIPK